MSWKKAPPRLVEAYVMAPPELVEDRKAIGVWVKKAFAFGQSLPPKAKKPTKKPAAKKKVK